jgi:hypothetical protein
MRRWYFLVLGGLAATGCGETGERAADPGRGAEAVAGRRAGGCEAPRPAAASGTRRVAVYFACAGGLPGQLYPAFRLVNDTIPAIEAALAALLRGPTNAERERGFHSFFSASTAGALLRVRASVQGDTVHVDFADLPRRLPATAGVKSFLPPGVMAELTWTIFGQFPEVQAVRFSVDGSERAFWAWLGGPPKVYTRTDWEQI